MNAERLLQHFCRISEAPDAISRLRRFIIDLAVRGKLVEQDPNEEPAAELLKRIQKEKIGLVKNGKIKEPKPVAITDTNKVFYEIPTNWKWVPLGECVNSHLGGGTPSKNNSTYWGGDIFWASVKDVGKGKYIDDTVDRITEAGLADSSSNLIPPGNLIVVTRMGLGKISINRVPIAINQDLRALFLSGLAAIDYYYIFFKTHGFEGAGLTVKGIRVEELMNIAFPLPPLAEQYRIVAKVNELMSLCDDLEAAKTEREQSRDRLVAASLQRLNQPANDETFRADARFTFDHLPRLTIRPAHIKQFRQTILNLAVRGKLVPQDPNDEPASKLLKRIQAEKTRLVKEGSIRKQNTQADIDADKIPFVLPSLWAWTRLGDVIHLVSGQHLQPSEYSGQNQSGPPYITGPADFGQNGLVITRYAIVRKAVAQKGQILLTVKGAGVGKTTVCDLPEVAISRQLMAMTAIEWSQRFLLLATHRLAATLKASARSLIPGISREDVDQFVFGLPPLTEQYRIVAKVDELMACCDRLEAQLTTTATDSRRLLEAVLHEALTPAREESRMISDHQTLMRPVTTFYV